MKYPKMTDLVAGSTSHLVVSNPSTVQTLVDFHHLVELAYRWASPANPFAAHTTLRPYLDAVGVPADQIGEPVDREFWLGDVLDAITADARRELTPAMFSNYKKLCDMERTNNDHKIAMRRDAAKRLPRAAARFRSNPDASPESRKAAVEKFEQFHRYPPTKITEFAKGFAIPTEVVRAGKAKWTTYRSAKVDPATLKRPKGPVDYIHEHNAGVHVYFPVGAEELDELEVDAKPTTVPRAYHAVEALVKLGESLGFCLKGSDGDDEFEALPKEELYCVPDGTCLVIVANRRNVVAMIWGGALGVFGRGIDG